MSDRVIMLRPGESITIGDTTVKVAGTVQVPSPMPWPMPWPIADEPVPKRQSYPGTGDIPLVPWAIGTTCQAQARG